MNIFYLDEVPKLAAQAHCDKHVVKMILETAQIICTVAHQHGAPADYRPTHRNHPCVRWAGQSRANLNFLYSLGLALGSEYTFRYGKTHKSLRPMTSAVTSVYGLLPTAPFTRPPQCMPEVYRQSDTVAAYRDYYRTEKAPILTYTRRPRPEWL